MCDRAQNGHWVNTQGNHSDHSFSHPNARKADFALSSTNKQYENNKKPPKRPGRKPAASSSPTGSTIAEADLLIAKENIEGLHKQIADLVAVRDDDLHLQLHKPMDLGNGMLATAARIANEMVNTHAKELRTTKETTSHAIAQTKQMRAHAHGFVELVLEQAANDKAPGKASCWTAFSGLHDDGAIDSADWAAGKKKKQSASSHSVYDIATFSEFTGSATMHSPSPHVAYQPTAAKVKAPELLIEHGPLGAVRPISAAFKKGKGKAPAKRKHDEIDEDKDKDEEEMDGSDSDGSGSGSQ